MQITYEIKGTYYDYEIEYEDFKKAINTILSDYSKEELIEIILNFDLCSVNLFKEYKDELVEYFRPYAEKKYIEVRYE